MSTRIRRFVHLIGGILSDPRNTLSDIVCGEYGALNYIIIFLILQITALQLPELVRAAWFMAAVDARGGASMLLGILTRPMLIPLLGMLSGSVLLGLLDRGRERPSGRRLELASTAVLPLLVLEGVAALLFGLVGWPGAEVVRLVVLGLGGGWGLVLLVLASRELRGSSPGEKRA